MLWACAACTARYSVGAPACPQCGSTQYREAPGGDVDEGAPVLDSAPDPAPEPTPEPAVTPVKAKANAAAPDTAAAAP